MCESIRVSMCYKEIILELQLYRYFAKMYFTHLLVKKTIIFFRIAVRFFFFFILLLLTLHVRSLLMSFYDSDRCFPFFEFIEIHFHIFHTSRENCCSLLNRCHIIFIVSFYFYLYPFLSRLKITEI